jgi:soluble lytic murein transglycosylase
VALALALASLALLAAAAAGEPPRLGAPEAAGDGRLRWAAPDVPPPAWAAGLALPPATRADSAALWTRALGVPRLADLARVRLGALRLADGDSAGADAHWGAVPAASAWGWPALRERAALAEVRNGAAAADALLEAAGREGWREPERAAWRVTRVRLRALAGDTAQALELARQAVHVYPATAAAGAALARLDALLAARGDTLGAATGRAAAEVEALRGDRAAAVRRLRRALPALPAAERAAAQVRLSELLRGARRFAEARAAARAAAAAAGTDARLRAAAALAHARAFRDAGAPDSALRWFAVAVRWAADPAQRETALWEAGREAEDEDRWEPALEAFARCAALGGPRAREAAQRAGLMHLAAGRADSASAWWAADTSDAGLFWWGVARRALGDRAAGDSALRRVAARPGWAFHRAAARDTLGVAGWSGAVAAAACAPDSACAATAAARDLAGLGLAEEAAALLARWSARDPRAPGAPPDSAPPGARLEAARLAYACGRPAQAIASADAAARAAEARGDAAGAWGAWAWAAPPAFEPLFTVPPDSVVATLEPALLWAVAWQESRFDPSARSRSDALGLMQLKLATAGDVAGWLRERRPDAAALFDPERSVRYGGRYLAHLLARVDRRVAVALSAYNAGPGSLPGRWRELVERGGEALFAEVASNADAQDYTRRVLGMRAAYRELRPALAGPGGSATVGP